MTAINAQSEGMIMMSREDLAAFKRSYEVCKPGGTFFFKGREVLRDYAKYVIQYLEGQFENK